MPVSGLMDADMTADGILEVKVAHAIPSVSEERSV